MRPPQAVVTLLFVLFIICNLPPQVATTGAIGSTTVLAGGCNLSTGNRALCRRAAAPARVEDEIDFDEFPTEQELHRRILSSVDPMAPYDGSRQVCIVSCAPPGRRITPAPCQQIYRCPGGH